MMTALDSRMLAIPEADWKTLLKDDRLQLISFNLQERRRRAAESCLGRQTLVGALSVAMGTMPGAICTIQWWGG